MSYITTSSGIHFDPIHPEKELINIPDIAHSLARICRANGHVSHFYTVAQHCLACEKEAEVRGYSARIRLFCLLHDASEVYLSDVTRPVKGLMKKYIEVEDRLLNEIWIRFAGTLPTEEEKEAVFSIDDDMLSYEFHYLMPDEIGERWKNILSNTDLSERNMTEVEQEFIQTANELIRQL